MGQRGTVVADLCKELGITSQTLYRHVAPDESLRADGKRALALRSGRSLGDRPGPDCLRKRLVPDHVSTYAQCQLRKSVDPRSFSEQVTYIKSSVRYFAESDFARCMRSACSSLFSEGGGAVRLPTGSPTAMKNSSCPAGVHMQRRRAGSFDLFLNE
jgi:hypothetical protein